MAVIKLTAALSPPPSHRLQPLAEVLALTALWMGVRIWLMGQTPILDTNDQVTFGLLPNDLLHGMQAGPLAYLPERHQGCALLWGVPCTTVFATLGPTVASLRVCSLVWQALMVATFLGTARVLGGRVAAGALAVLWIGAPPTIAYGSMSGLPDHIDAGLLLAGALLLGSRLNPTDGQHRSAARASLAGGLLGLSGFFMFDALVVAAAIGLALAVRLRTQWSLLLAGFAGFVVGLSPLLFGAGWWTTPQGGEFFARLGGAGGPGRGLGPRAAALLAEQLPLSLGLPDPVSVPGGHLPAAGAAGVVLLVLGLLLLWAASRTNPTDSRWLARISGAACGLHLIACIGSGLDLGNSRYLWPVWPWLALGASLGLGDLVQRSGAQRVTAATALLALVGLSNPASSAAVLRGPTEVPPEVQAWVEGESGFHLLEHPLGYETLLAKPGDGLRAAASARSDHRLSLLRLYGRRQRIDGAVPPCPPSLGAGIPWCWLGVGRQLFLDAIHATPKDDPIAAAGRAEREARGLPRAALVGVGLGTASHLPGGPEEGVEIPFRGELNRAFCFGLGLAAAENSRGTGVFGWIAPGGGCPAEELAVGFGLGTGLRQDSRRARAAPSLSQWAGQRMKSEAEAGYRCGLSAGLAAGDALGVDGWETPRPDEAEFPGLDCFPTPEPPDPEPSPTPPRPESRPPAD